jgi:hypothetical protein
MSESPPPIAFPKEFAANANAAMDSLFAAFPDHYPRLVSEEEHEWHFRLDWPSDPLWYVDPHIAEAARSMYGCSLQELLQLEDFRPCAKATFLFSMFHSRALLAPARAAECNEVTNFTNIIHVDDHDDLIRPLLSARNGFLFDPFSGLLVNIDDEASVRGAIERGVISKGSFLTAYVLAKPAGSIVHVKGNSPRRESWLRRRDSTITLAGKPHPISFTEYSEARIANSWHIAERPDLPLQLPNSDAVWLDVDLDAFCNRYDGDSDRRDIAATVGEQQEMRTQIKGFLAALQQAEWKSQVKAISLAASPSFFPSDYWSYAVREVADGLHEILCGA